MHVHAKKRSQGYADVSMQITRSSEFD